MAMGSDGLTLDDDAGRRRAAAACLGHVQAANWTEGESAGIVQPAHDLSDDVLRLPNGL